jgi:hypothetical protein
MPDSKLLNSLDNAIAYSWVLGWYVGLEGVKNDSGKMQAVTAIKAQHPEIVEACNQHDTLKAKAGLLDGFTEWLESRDDSPYVLGQTTSELVDLVVTLTDKAKGLTNE